MPPDVAFRLANEALHWSTRLYREFSCQGKVWEPETLYCTITSTLILTDKVSGHHICIDVSVLTNRTGHKYAWKAGGHESKYDDMVTAAERLFLHIQSWSD